MSMRMEQEQIVNVMQIADIPSAVTEENINQVIESNVLRSSLFERCAASKQDEQDRQRSG